MPWVAHGASSSSGDIPHGGAEECAAGAGQSLVARRLGRVIRATAFKCSPGLDCDCGTRGWPVHRLLCCEAFPVLRRSGVTRRQPAALSEWELCRPVERAPSLRGGAMFRADPPSLRTGAWCEVQDDRLVNGSTTGSSMIDLPPSFAQPCPRWARDARHHTGSGGRPPTSCHGTGRASRVRDRTAGTWSLRGDQGARPMKGR